MSSNRILIDISVIAEILRYDLSVKGKETAGLLLGRELDGILHVDKIDVGDQTGSAVHVEISEEALVMAASMVSEIEDNQVIVGWWHTHPGLRSFMSSTDVNTQTLYQKFYGNAIAIVVDANNYASSHQLADLDFGVYRVVNGTTKRLRYEVVAPNTTMNIEEALERMVFGSSRPRPAVNGKEKTVMRKSPSKAELAKIRADLQGIRHDLPDRDYYTMQMWIDMLDAVESGVIMEMPVEVSTMLDRLEDSIQDISFVIDELNHLKNEEGRMRAFVATVGLVVLELALIFVPRFLIG